MINQFESYQNNYCFHNADNTGFSYQFPKVNYYDNPTCSNAPNSTVSLPTTCAPVTVYPANENPYAVQWYYGEVPYIASPAPTATPTAAPTKSAYEPGFVYVNFYNNYGCTGSIVAVTGRPSGVCITSYDDPNSAKATGSYMFTCNADYSVTAQYSDAECMVPMTNYSTALGCRSLLGRFGSAEGVCSSDDSQLPLPSDTFVTEM